MPKGRMGSDAPVLSRRELNRAPDVPAHGARV
jgi:hypothetical protein